MPKQCHEAAFDESMAVVFAGLVRSLARRRWAEAGLPGPGELPLPRVGCRYENRRGSVLRRGRVLEVLRPVSVTLYETLFDMPCRVRLECRWRIESTPDGCLLRLRLRYQLNGAAALRRRHWRNRIHAHCTRMLGFVRAEIPHVTECHGAGVSGHSTGSSSMAATKMISVNGTPSLR